MIKMLKNKKGFTLIELMIVIAIIAILAIVLIPNAMKFKENAKLTGVETNARTVQAQIETMIDNYADAATLANDLAAKLGTSVKNPIGGVATPDVIDVPVTAPASSAAIDGTPVAIYTHDSIVGDTLFAAGGTVKDPDLAGSVVVAISGSGKTLQADIYNYDADGNPSTGKTVKKVVKK